MKNKIFRPRKSLAPADEKEGIKIGKLLPGLCATSLKDGDYNEELNEEGIPVGVGAHDDPQIVTTRKAEMRKKQGSLLSGSWLRRSLRERKFLK